MKEWIADNEPNLDWFIRPRRFPRAIRDDRDQRPERQPEEISLGDGRTLVLDPT